MIRKYLLIIAFYFGDLCSTLETCQILVNHSFEVILYDNSRCLSYEDISNSSHIQIVAPCKNEGVYGAYRYAFSLISSSDFTHLLFLDQDSTISSSYIQTCMTISSSNSFARCALAPFDKNNLIRSKTIPDSFTSFIHYCSTLKEVVLSCRKIFVCQRYLIPILLWITGIGLYVGN